MRNTVLLTLSCANVIAQGRADVEPNGTYITPRQAAAAARPEQLRFAYEALRKLGPEVFEPPGGEFLAQIPPSCLSLVTIDWDGTLEATDMLAHAIIDEATPAELMDDMQAAYQRFVGKIGGVGPLVEGYFGGDERLASLRSGLDKLRSEVSGNVYVLSASWSPIPGNVWAAYLLNISQQLDLGFDAEHIIGIDDPGADIAAEKNTSLTKLAGELGIAPAAAAHVDNSFKYGVQALTSSANAMLAAPVQEADLVYLASLGCNRYEQKYDASELQDGTASLTRPSFGSLRQLAKRRHLRQVHVQPGEDTDIAAFMQGLDIELDEAGEDSRTGLESEDEL